MSGRKIKKKIFDFLAQDDIKTGIHNICKLPEKQSINPLFSFLFNSNPLIKWHAITAMGAVVSQLTDKEVEAARVIMRRLMWNLNDESGGIGWGSPEAMGEIIARTDLLANEYANILISYIDPDGNYLEHEMLQRGVLWGIGRFAHAKPKLAEQSVPFLLPYLEAKDNYLKGLAGWTCGIYLQEGDDRQLDRLAKDNTLISFYYNYELIDISISSLVKQSV